MAIVGVGEGKKMRRMEPHKLERTARASDSESRILIEGYNDPSSSMETELRKYCVSVNLLVLF
jgi:hypothetical protein